MTDVLMFVEDPGAANFMVPMIPALQTRGLQVALRVDGAAISYIGQDSAVPALKPEVSADALLDTVAPRAIFTGTSENELSLGLSLIAAARARGIPSVAAVDSQSNAASRFRGRTADALTFAPDHLLVPDDFTADAYAALGYPSASLTVCGHPHYDSVLARLAALQAEGQAQVRARVLGQPTIGPVVVFVAEVSTGLAPEQYRHSQEYLLHGSGRYAGRTEIVVEEFLDAVEALRPRPFTLLRLHPKNTRAELAPFLDRFDRVSQGGSGLELVFAADAVCGMTSMLLAEAAIARRPTLSILPRVSERDWLPSLVQGTIAVATSRGALQDFMQGLSGRAAPSVLPKIRTGAAERAADALVGMLSAAGAAKHA